ncbi:RNA polymerase sigma factor [Botryobacter ruber]|uniref:RNA polymerase sigma factor n=1 Tax=Botryobacter ruber TaxID=2171629 RepID=UPI000E0B84A7|nr:hypothetical protein [Botryobacter ruber]
MKVVQLNNNQEQKALWVKFQSGDKAAFAQIYQRNISILYQYAKSLGAANDLVDAAIQQLFVEMWTNRATLPVPASVSFYFYAALKSRLENSRSLQKEAHVKEPV